MMQEDARLRSELEERLRFETLLADLSAKFINLPATDVNRQIQDAQRRICECLGLNTSVLWEWELDAPDILVLTSIYRAVDGPPVPERLNATEFFPWSVRLVASGKIILLSSMDEVPEEGTRDVESYRYFNVKALVDIPLSAGGGPPFGVFTVCDTLSERGWPEPLIKRLELVAQVFANALLRKRAEQTLQESEERLRLATDSAELGLWSLNLANKRFWVTAMTRKLFQFPADEIMTWERYLGLIHPEDRPLVQRELQQVMQSGAEGMVEYRVLQADGKVRWMLSRGRLQHHGRPEFDSVMGVTMDITARKQTEAKAQQQHLELAHLSRLSILGEISGSLAHELNQPLGAILANAQATRRWLAGDHPNLDETRAAIEDIIRDDKRAGEIVHRVRALAKKDAPKSQLLDLNSLARETTALLHSELVAADVPLALELQPLLPAVKASYVELQQSLLNLMLNGLQAQQATERSRRKLTVTTHDADGAVIMAVRDRGPGLSPDIAPRIFDAFFTTKPDGLGLGLAFCRRIAEIHGGKLWAENHPDGGAVFSLSLPAQGE
jgi:PAS domain S-box-containing protein